MARLGTDNHLGSAAWKARRLQILRRDDFTCAYCGQPANSVDHVIPRVRGGNDDDDNLVAACGRCNSKKSSRPVGGFSGKDSTPPIVSETISPLVTVYDLYDPITGRPLQNG